MSYVYGNTTRLTGLASGMDTDSIVKNLMQIEQLKVNRELRSRTLVQWKQEALTSVKTDITGFRDNFLSVLGKNSMLKSSTYVKYAVSTADTSGAVSLSANADNTAKNVTVNQVHQLATATRAQSTLKTDGSNTGSVLTGNLAEGNNVKLGDLSFTNGLEFDANGNFSFRINGEDFTFNRNDTLQNMLSTVSNNENAGVVLNYSRLSNTFTLSAKEAGAGQSLSFSNITGNAFGAGGAFQLEAGAITAGVNARVTIDGVTVEKSSNTFTVDGMTFTLNKETEADADIRFDITQDVESAVDAIKEFVEGYNTLVKKLQDLLSEKKTKDEQSYTPLTEDEKAEMTEEQIKTWEEIAKKGLLYNDRDIQSMLSNLRNSLYETIQGTGLSMSQLGLKTGNYFEGNLGEIKLDEDTLRKALETDATQVMNAFMKAPSKVGGSDGGYIYNLQNIFNQYTNVTQWNTLDSLDGKLTALTKRITTLEDRMKELEESYYLKFSAMEKALSELQSQSNSLAGLLGTNNS